MANAYMRTTQLKRKAEDDDVDNRALKSIKLEESPANTLLPRKKLIRKTTSTIKARPRKPRTLATVESWRRSLTAQQPALTECTHRSPAPEPESSDDETVVGDDELAQGGMLPSHPTSKQKGTQELERIQQDLISLRNHYDNSAEGIHSTERLRNALAAVRSVAKTNIHSMNYSGGPHQAMLVDMMVLMTQACESVLASKDKTIEAQQQQITQNLEDHQRALARKSAEVEDLQQQLADSKTPHHRSLVEKDLEIETLQASLIERQAQHDHIMAANAEALFYSQLELTHHEQFSNFEIEKLNDRIKNQMQTLARTRALHKNEVRDLAQMLDESNQQNDDLKQRYQILQVELANLKDRSVAADMVAAAEVTQSVQSAMHDQNIKHNTLLNTARNDHSHSAHSPNSWSKQRKPVVPSSRQSRANAVVYLAPKYDEHDLGWNDLPSDSKGKAPHDHDYDPNHHHHRSHRQSSWWRVTAPEDETSGSGDMVRIKEEKD